MIKQTQAKAKWGKRPLGKSLPVWRTLAAAALFLAAGASGSAETVRVLAGEPISYVVDLRAATTHLAKVTMTIPESKPGTEVQFPAWNALYQIRDFVRNVQGIEADCDEKPLQLVRVDLYTWSSGTEPCHALKVRYAVYLAEEGVFSSILDENHAYINLAMALFYLPRERTRSVRARYVYPQKWSLATLISGPDADGWYIAANYDELVDSPVEAGIHQEYSYDQNGAHYRIIVHAEPRSYDSHRLVESVKKITAAGTSLMQDVPFSRYTFLYHFSREGGGGGMEHRDGTAISITGKNLGGNWTYFESITAHEFTHAWNVKRIRPQNLEPVDYIRGNDTSDLWLCEGLSNTLAEYILLRAGLISRKAFYARLAGEIGRLEERPARKLQSVEEAGREAWLEKYPDHQRPDRSISYYNKGQIVGVLLDLAIRHASGSTHSLDDLFRRLNTDFAKRGRFYTREDVLRILYELAPVGCDFRQFFEDYVSGTRALDYQTYFSYAGLGRPSAMAKGATPQEFDEEMLAENKQASPEQVRLREHWLRGTTLKTAGEAKP